MREPSPRSQTAEVAIVGGGVIGLAIARGLALRGARDVVVIEKNELGREASWAAGGILAPQVEAHEPDDFFRLACAGRDLYREFAHELETETGVQVELDTTGTLYVALNETDELELQRRHAWQERNHLRVEWMNGDEVRRAEPSLSTSTRSALLFPDDYQIENRKLLEALIVANRRLNVRLLEACQVTRLLNDGGKTTGVQTSRGAIHAAAVVMAAGAWCSTIDTPEPIEVEPIRGQMLCFDAGPQFARHVLYSSRGYLVPRQDGRLLAGSTADQAGFDKRVTEAGSEIIKSMAFEIAPSLHHRPVMDRWAGFRPRAADGLPVLGRSPTIDGLFYATGHYRNGILLAPITADLIAEAIVNGASSSLLAAFSPERFTSDSDRKSSGLQAGSGATTPGHERDSTTHRC